MPYSVLVGSDTLTRNAPLVLFRVGVCERGSPIVRHPCRSDRPDWCGQGIQPCPPESQSLVLTTCVCLIHHAPSDTRLPRKLVRVAFPWHLGTRRLTAHRPLGIEASCFEPQMNEGRKTSRMDLKGCFQPDGRDQETGSHVVDSPPFKTRRAHAPRRNTPLRGRPHFVGAECFMPDIHVRSGGSEKIVLQQFSQGFCSKKDASALFKSKQQTTRSVLASLILKSSTWPL